ncbi:MAG: hypothetical protein JXQ25_07200 [Deltaproteobacteria bacterium]|nr:hypothetical protein [Deltaproteobacteria bacterium]
MATDNKETPEKKKGGCLKILVIIILLLAVGLGVATWQLNGIVKAAVQTMGPEITGTAVSLDSVSISPLGGSGEISNLVIESPQGFDNRKMIEVGKAGADVAVSSVLSGRPAVNSVFAEGVSARFETGPSGSNAGIIMANMEKFAGEKSKSTSSGSGDLGIDIGDLLFKSILVNLGTTGQVEGAGLKVSIGEISGNFDKGDIILTGLVVSNPKGYQSETALSIPQVKVSFDAKSLLSEKIVINSVYIEQLDAIYETSIGGSNFTAIQKEVDIFEQSMAKGGSDNKNTQSFLIKELKIDAINGQLSPSLLRNVGVKPTAKLKNIELTNLESENGAGLINKIMLGVMPQLEGMGTGLVKNLGEVGKVIGETGKQVGETAVEGVKNVSGALKKGIGGIFGRKTTTETTEQKDDGVDMGDE